MKAPTIITSMARALGIVSSVEEVAIVPLEKWHAMFKEREQLRWRVKKLEEQLAAVEQGRAS